MIDNTLCKDCTLFLPYSIPFDKNAVIENKPENCCIFIYAKDKEGCKVYERI